MPMRSRSGVVRSPERVVAPTSVNGCSSIRTDRAAGPLADNKVELIVLHRGIEHFFDGGIEAVNFVDEQDVIGLEVGQDGRKIAGLGDHRARGCTETDAEFARDYLCEGGFPQARRTVQQNVVEGLLALLRGGNENRKVFTHRALTDEIAHAFRTQRRIVVVLTGGGNDAGVISHRRRRVHATTP